MSANPYGGLHGVYRRRSVPLTADTLEASLDREAKGREVGPCENCHNRERCSAGFACVSLELFVNTGRFSAAAPRQPCRDIFERLYRGAGYGLSCWRDENY
jgi:hypothetical protein